MPKSLASTKQATPAALLRRMVQQSHDLRTELANHPDADSIAEAAACAAPILAAAPPAEKALSWLKRQLAPWEKIALAQAAALSAQHSALSPSPPLPVSLSHTPAHLYDHFLHRYSSTSRKRRGVFFTPQPIADYIITQIDRLLRTDFNLPAGLATHSALRTPHSALPLLLDPACGTGIFPLALIDHLHRTLGRRFSAFVPDLLSRLTAIEILPPAAFLAKLNITLKLAQTGYDFTTNDRLNILTGDALSPETQSQIPNPKSQILPVLLGNPPFSSLSTTTNPWIARLVRGDDEIRGYVRANGQQLGERKTWLHDDYVKFIRLAQWHVEQAGCGIVGFVTNHGFLDNATFRLMRHELLRVFPRIEILNLHGNRKKHEVSPDGTPDENVFRLDQGLAISVFCCPPTPTRSVSEGLPPTRVEYSELWGSRNEKLVAIANPSNSLRAALLAPQSPDWRFLPSPRVAPHPEYAAAWSLADAMPLSTTAPVTARDHFVVAFTAEELISRIAEFCDLTIPDDQIRQRYFQRTRSARYQPGDTRGWKLSEARRIVAADPHSQEKIIRCLYRPFDWRYVFWHPAMIDWPRTEVTRHLLETECGMQNAECGMKAGRSPVRHSALRTPRSALCLIARRQQLPTQPCTFFWIADCLALDGVIRSDNRGSESLFPVYVETSTLKHSTWNLKLGTWNRPWHANFAPAFIEQFCAATELTWLPLGRGNLKDTFGPEDLLAYIYALFHSPTYRTRYADSLRTDFPRVLPPRNAAIFKRICQFGQELIDLHVLRPPHSALRTPHLPAVASFRAGGYPALRKWLQPKHRTPADPQYTHIAAAIHRTQEIMQSIDKSLLAPSPSP